MRSMKKIAAAVAVVSALTLSAACGADDTEAASADDTTSTQSTPMDDSASDEAMADPAANLVGPGCADYAKAVPDGAGSVAGMAQDPVAVAASNNPLLKTLVAAVSGQLNPKVNLVDTLNGDEFTVFAPVDDAFAQLPKKTVTSLAQPKNADLLTSILTYHVVPGKVMAADVVNLTEAKTVNGKPVAIRVEGDTVMINNAKVAQADINTSNGVIHVVDAVILPPEG